MVEEELALATALRLARAVSAVHREVRLPAEAMAADGWTAHLVLSEQEPAGVTAATEVSAVAVQAATPVVLATVVWVLRLRQELRLP